MDWEVVEEVVPRLKAALETAKERKPDSPVHALLERVYPEQARHSRDSAPHGARSSDSGQPLAVYEQIVAEHWLERKSDISALIEEHGKDVFGARALGELCLRTSPMGADGARVAFLLYNHGQYCMSRQLYQQLRSEEPDPEAYQLSSRDMVHFASAVSECEPTVSGAEDGLSLLGEALVRAGDQPPADERFRMHYGLAGLLMWKWRLTNTPDMLEKSTRHFALAIEAAQEMERLSEARPLGQIAKLQLRLLVGLRKRDGTAERKDVEGFRDAILALDESEAVDSREASYLRWYKAIVHADIGREEAVRESVLRAVREDALVLRDKREDTVEIGGMQYALLRRFIEDNLPFLRNHTRVGYISQALQYASQCPTANQ